MKFGKNIITLGSAFLLIASLVGCEAQAAEAVEVIKTPVEVMELVSEERQQTLSYMGTVAPENQMNYSFKSSGRLGSVLVSPGEHVEKGTVLAKLDTSDIELQLGAIRAQMVAAEQDVSKAENAYTYNRDILDKMKNLYASGSISKDALDQVELNFNTVSSSLSQAKEGYRAAKANYDLSASLLEDAVVVAASEGTVLTVPYEEGELVSAGYPVVVMRSAMKVVEVGLSQDDVELVNLDTDVHIEVGERSIPGKIVELNDMPDQYTRTFLAKIRVESADLRLGKIVDVKFETGNEAGIWVPLNSIMSDGEQYVYVIQEGRAFKKTLTIEGISGFEAQVNGVEDGDTIVVSGIKKLTDGTAVDIVEAR